MIIYPKMESGKKGFCRSFGSLLIDEILQIINAVAIDSKREQGSNNGTKEHEEKEEERYASISLGQLQSFDSNPSSIDMADCLTTPVCIEYSIKVNIIKEGNGGATAAAKEEEDDYDVGDGIRVLVTIS